MSLFLPVLLGTIRDGRKSYNAAKLVESIGAEYPNVKTQLLDPRDFSFPNEGDEEDKKDPKYTDIVKRADGFFIVTPEYNHGYPSSLKRMLDSELDLYVHKPVAIAGVSSGQWGGVRVVENLLPVVRHLGLIVTRSDTYFPNIKKLFDDQGKLLDEKYRERIKRAWDELILLAAVLKKGKK